MLLFSSEGRAISMIIRNGILNKKCKRRQPDEHQFWWWTRMIDGCKVAVPSSVGTRWLEEWSDCLGHTLMILHASGLRDDLDLVEFSNLRKENSFYVNMRIFCGSFHSANFVNASPSLSEICGVRAYMHLVFTLSHRPFWMSWLGI